MPEHAPISQPDLLRDITLRIAEAERQVSRLKATRSDELWGRGDHTVLPASPEGLHIIDISDESVWYVSNGEWRQLCPCGCETPCDVLTTPRIVGTLSVGGFTATTASPHTEVLSLSDNVDVGEMVVIYDVTQGATTDSSAPSFSDVVCPVRLFSSSAFCGSFQNALKNSNTSAPEPPVGFTTGDVTVARTLGAHVGTAMAVSDQIGLSWTPTDRGTGTELLTVTSSDVVAIALPGASSWDIFSCGESDDYTVGFDDDVSQGSNSTGWITGDPAIDLPAGGENTANRILTVDCCLTGGLLTAYANKTSGADFTPSVTGESVFGTYALMAFTFQDLSDLLPDGAVDISAGGSWDTGGRNSAMASLYVYACREAGRTGPC